MPPRLPISVVDLEPHAAAELARAAGPIRADPYAEGDVFARQVRAAAASLPQGDLTAVVDHFAAQQGSSSLLIRGVPIPASLPRTPAGSFHQQPEARPTGAEPVLALVGARLGEVFAYREWDGAHLVQNRYPVASHHQVQTASGANDLVLHTEACFTAYPPDFLALLGLRPDPTGQAVTLVSDIPQALAQLTPAERGALREPLFVFPTDRGSYDHEGRRTTEPVPLLKDRADGPALEYSTLITAITAPAAAALAALEEALGRCAQSVLLGSGDLLLIDNRQAVHGRTAFRPAYDGTDRWIQRVLLLRQLPSGGRVVPDTRLAHYPTDYIKALALPA
ncbi:L-asparagine oxygenase [Streptacidiphilus sp. MAP12-20]|uniref:TauD/TfdA family dioxygenase n=1 Tax=Streptacidiphilus sp. MAP12-20 TaxID=3156299 RepID=UPI003512FC9B